MTVGRTGTVTFLFTDIVGSTRRWAEDETAMAAALERHDADLRSAVDRNNGRIFKHTGDGVVAVFDSATAAVRSALDAQEVLPLPVRIGLHTGEAEARDDDFFGPALNRCARIMDAGHGGQILISSATRELLDDTVAEPMTDLGPHLLKGIEEPVTIHQVGLGDHPPLRTISGEVRLPSISSTLIGRDAIVHRVADELDGHHLVTLTGVGGTGKTRVAIAAAEERRGRHGLIVFVDLGEITDDDEVVPAACRALSVADHRMTALAIALGGRHALMVLDNCEHVVPGAADLADELLSTPDLRILATSREGLALDGERLIAIPGLSTDDDRSAAVDLFLDRAASTSPRLAITGDDLSIVRDICHRLDGLPLAIELAAARIGVLSPRDLFDRLDERFQLLTGGRRKRSRDRQRTLRETIDWSYELLDDDERDLFERMAVFGGNFVLDSAVALADERPEHEVLDLLGALIDKSLLTTIDIDGQHRYRYLETIRGYAVDRFDERADAAEILDRYQAHLEGLVAKIVEALDGDPRAAARRLRAEIPNLRTSFDRALERGDVRATAALLGPPASMMRFLDWRFNGWASEALELDEAADSPHAPVLLAALIGDEWLHGRFDRLHDLSEQTLAAALHHDITSAAVDDLVVAGHQLSGDDAGVERIARGIIERATAAGDDDVELRMRLTIAWIHAEPAGGTGDGAWTADDETAIRRAVEHDVTGLRLTGQTIRGLRARALGDYDLMIRCGEQLEAVAVPGSSVWFTGLQIRSFAEFYLGRRADAIRTADADLEEAYRVGDRSAMVLPLLVDALVLDALDEIEGAAIVRGALPRRMTVMFMRELADLDRRLVDRLDPDRRRDLAVAGTRKTPRELQELTHRLAMDHVDLADGAGQVAS